MKIAAAFALSTAVVVQAANIKPLILGGTVVPAGEKTYTVGLRQSPGGDSFCGGSLISPTHVLSAGHCSGDVQYIAIGTHYLNGTSDGEVIAVKSETTHPRYNEGTTTPGVDDTALFDFNIIELASPSKFTPVALSTADPDAYAGTFATVMGWGDTAERGRPSYELLRVDVPLKSTVECQAIFGGSLPESFFCAGGEENKDSCQGDSGGPIIVERPTGDVLLGVVTGGFGCGRAGSPGIYSKASLVKDWILSLVPTASFV